MDYFTVDGVRLRTGYENKRDWYLLPIRELLDNDIDFLQKHYKGSDMARINVDINMDDRLFRLKIRNSNDKNIAVFPNLGAIFNFDMKYGSKQDVHIISRGMLGDALKQVLSLGYVLLQGRASSSFKDRQWDLPLIIRHNKKEWLIYLKVYSAQQEYTVTVERTENQVPFTDTEIELKLPVIDQVRNSLTRDYVEEFCRKYALPTTDISFKFRIVDGITHYAKTEGDGTDLEQDITRALTKVPPKGILSIDVSALHPIAKDWRNRDSVQSKNPDEFMRRFHNIHDKNAYSVWDVLVQFKEGTQIKKTAQNEISVSQLVSSKDPHKKMEKLFYELRKYSDPQAQLELPYTTNPKMRKEMLYKRIAESGLYNIRGEDKAVYKLVRDSCEEDNGIIQYPYAVEIMAVPFTEPFDSHGNAKQSIVIGAVNYSISPKPNTFVAEYYTFDKHNKDAQKNIFRVLENYNFENYAESYVKLPCIILVNLITPRRDPLTHDKSAVDAQPFIRGIKSAVEKMAKEIQTYRADNWTFTRSTGGRARGEYQGDKSKGKLTAIEVVRRFLVSECGLPQSADERDRGSEL